MRVCRVGSFKNLWLEWCRNLYDTVPPSTNWILSDDEMFYFVIIIYLYKRIRREKNRTDQMQLSNVSNEIVRRINNLSNEYWMCIFVLNCIIWVSNAQLSHLFLCNFAGHIASIIQIFSRKRYIKQLKFKRNHAKTHADVSKHIHHLSETLLSV